MSKGMNILIIGPSGSGKSTIGRLLKERGYNFVEADTDTHQGTSIAYFRDKETGEGVNMPWPRPKNWSDKTDWVWRVHVLQKQLGQWPESINFVSGEAHNKRKAYAIFDKILVLSTDDQTLRKRILARTDNYFGKDPAQFAWIVEQNRTLKDEAKFAKGIIIDTSKPINEVIDNIIELVHA